jgi:glycosyltransferase involved in cell wall biosynthesis
MSSDPVVTVLLSAYNGADFIEQQLNSLLLQTSKNFVIYVRDDGSADATRDIINQYCLNNLGVVFHVCDELGNLGAANSFLALLNYVKEPAYVMFCDQDDVWFPDKIEKFLSRIREVEFGQPSGTPVLIFGDMVVTDEFLSVISDSFWNYQRIQVSGCRDWQKLLVSNCVTGCSSIINLQATHLLRAFDSSPVLHDLLAAVLVAKNGVVEPMSIPTMYYRQHAVNVEGARNFGVGYLVSRLRRFITDSVPKYVVFCRVMGMPLWLAAFLKLGSVISRLMLRSARGSYLLVGRSENKK